MSLDELGLNWNENDIIRVRSLKKQGKIILERQPNRYAKQVAYRLTKTAGGQSKHQLGIYISQKNTRFSKLANTNATPAAFRKISDKSVEVHLPQEIFA